MNFTLTNYSSITNGNNSPVVILVFTFAKFDFFLNGKTSEMSSDGGSTCDETQLIKVLDNYKYGIFGELENLYINFEYRSSNSNFQKWCPLIFKNINIQTHFLSSKPIRFFRENSSHNINSRIKFLQFNSLVVDNFDKEILHPQVYSSVISITIIGSVKKIETDVFKDLINLKSIELGIYDLKGLIHGNGIEWINYVSFYTPRLNVSLFKFECDLKCILLLNSSVSYILFLTYRYDSTTISDIKNLSSWPNLEPYDFPDKDFCIFSNYPQDRSMVLIFNDDLDQIDCTCTIIWITRNAAFLANYSALYGAQPICNSLVTNTSEFEMAFDACGFSEKYQKCQLNMAALNQSLASYTDSYFQFYDTQYVLIEIRNILKNYFDYWLLVLGFLANFITVIVIINAYRKASAFSNNKNNQLGSIKENFFRYVLINSSINSIYCLIMFFSETFACVPNLPDERYSKSNCNISDICIAATASVLKLTANVTFLQMSLNRYLLVGKDHAEWLKKLGKANIGIVLIFALSTSCLLSYVVVEQENFFNYARNQSESNYGYFHNNKRNEYGVDNYMMLFLAFKNRLPLIKILKIILDLFSYFLFCILNLVLDVMTVVKLKETLSNKARLGVQSKEKKDEQERTERRSIIMVVLNSLVNIILRIPELLSSVGTRSNTV
jgi:hypothetical protein